MTNCIELNLYRPCVLQRAASRRGIRPALVLYYSGNTPDHHLCRNTVQVTLIVHGTGYQGSIEGLRLAVGSYNASSAVQAEPPDFDHQNEIDGRDISHAQWRVFHICAND